MEKLLEFLRSQGVHPYEVAFGVFAVYSGFSGLFDYGVINSIFEQVLGSWLANALNITYVLAGFSLFLGIGLGKRNVEGFGILLVMMSLLIRSVVTFHHVGVRPDIANSYVYSLCYLIASSARLKVLIQRRMLVETSINFDFKK